MSTNLDERRRCNLPAAVALVRRVVAAWPDASTAPYRAAIQWLAGDPFDEARHGNRVAEAQAVLRGFLGEWPQAPDALRAAVVAHIRESCRSCGDPATRNSLCAPCWA